MQVTLDAFETAAQDWSLHLTPLRKMNRDEYRAFVAANPDLRIERNAEGDVIVMPPAHTRTSIRNGELYAQLHAWARADRRGYAVDSSGGFDLPNGSNRSPDASWILKSRVDALTEDERSEYFPLCPDFVVELRSKSDRLPAVHAKMREYIDNGAKLGWLVDPIERRVHVYRPEAPVETFEHPAAIGGDPELPGFVLDLAPVWDPEA